MSFARKVQRTVLELAAATAIAAPTHATTLRHMGLEELVKANGSIVVGEVVDVHSYWNEEGTFILTDVRVAPVEVIHGKPVQGDLTLTLMGGTVGDLRSGKAKDEALRAAQIELIPESAPRPGRPRRLDRAQRSRAIAPSLRIR